MKNNKIIDNFEISYMLYLGQYMIGEKFHQLWITMQKGGYHFKEDYVNIMSEPIVNIGQGRIYTHDFTIEEFLKFHHPEMIPRVINLLRKGKENKSLCKVISMKDNKYLYDLIPFNIKEKKNMTFKFLYININKKF